ncbi:MAG TPA: hypothetical protein VF990_13775 [Candidatus Dormibacteraeota bacterium]
MVTSVPCLRVLLISITPDGGSSFAHRAQSQVTREGARSVEPVAVVAHAWHELVATCRQRNDDRRGASVLGNVVQRLLPDPV